MAVVPGPTEKTLGEENGNALLAGAPAARVEGEETPGGPVPLLGADTGPGCGVLDRTGAKAAFTAPAGGTCLA